jgi:hypothetical protein
VNAGGDWLSEPLSAVCATFFLDAAMSNPDAGRITFSSSTHTTLKARDQIDARGFPHRNACEIP